MCPTMLDVGMVKPLYNRTKFATSARLGYAVLVVWYLCVRVIFIYKYIYIVSF